MSVKLYVGNLSFRTTTDDLNALFAEAGSVVSATVMSDRVTGQSRGFGFVEMESEDGANAAIEQLDGRSVDGRNIKVNVARPKTEGFGGGDRGGDRGGFRSGGGGGGRGDRGGFGGGGGRGDRDRDRGGFGGRGGRGGRGGGW
ncbi:MAG: RNA-binding protein [Blastocatellia bacterium]|nr:RNA-binding protein [Blastocatellia bacterium]